MTHNDLTILYYTANTEPENFLANTQKQLLKAVGDTRIVSVSFKPTVIGTNCTNICIGEQKRNNYMLYKQVLMAAREAKTEYVATAEDDMLYSAEHFTYRPKKDVFAYDVNKWSIFSWVEPPVFSFRVRKLMSSLIVTRDALVKTLEERYNKYPVFEEIPKEIFDLYWGEPGRFENHLGIPTVKTEEYKAAVPNIMFSTGEALGYLHLGKRKAHSPIKAESIEYWGSAVDVLKLYKQ